jgi:hypothetical protein
VVSDFRPPIPEPITDVLARSVTRERLDRRVESALAGAGGRIALVTGEPGSDKTIYDLVDRAVLQLFPAPLPVRCRGAQSFLAYRHDQPCDRSRRRSGKQNAPIRIVAGLLEPIKRPEPNGGCPRPDHHGAGDRRDDVCGT